MISEVLQPVQATVQNILSHPTWDVVTLFAFLAVGFFYGISAGVRKIGATILYTYAAYAVASVASAEALARTFSSEPFVARIGIFCAVFLVLVLSFGIRPAAGRGDSPWWKLFLLSFLQAGLFMAIVLSFLPAAYAGSLAPLTKTLFGGAGAAVWWIVSPLGVLVVLRWIERFR